MSIELIMISEDDGGVGGIVLVVVISFFAKAWGVADAGMGRWALKAIRRLRDD